MYPDWSKGVAKIGELNVLREEELLEPGEGGCVLTRRHVEEDHVARLEHVQVGEHPALGSQPRGVTPRPRLKGFDVVRQQPLQICGPISTTDPNRSAGAGFAENCAVI